MSALRPLILLPSITFAFASTVAIFWFGSKKKTKCVLTPKRTALYILFTQTNDSVAQRHVFIGVEAFQGDSVEVTVGRVVRSHQANVAEFKVKGRCNIYSSDITACCIVENGFSDLATVSGKRRCCHERHRNWR